MLVEAIGLVFPPMISRLTEQLVNRRGTKVRLTQLEDDVRRMLTAQQQATIQQAELHRIINVLVRLLITSNPQLFNRHADALVVKSGPEASRPDIEQLSNALSRYIAEVTAAIERRHQRIAPMPAVPAPSKNSTEPPRPALGVSTIDDALDEFGRDFDEQIAQRRLSPRREDER